MSILKVLENLVNEAKGEEKRKVSNVMEEMKKTEDGFMIIEAIERLVDDASPDLCLKIWKIIREENQDNDIFTSYFKRLAIERLIFRKGKIDKNWFRDFLITTATSIKIITLFYKQNKIESNTVKDIFDNYIQERLREMFEHLENIKVLNLPSREKVHITVYKIEPNTIKKDIFDNYIPKKEKDSESLKKLEALGLYSSLIS